MAFGNNNLGKLIVEIGADIKDLQDKLSQSSARLTNFANETKVTAAGIAGGLALVGTTVAAALAASVAQTVNYGDKIFEASQKTGVAAEAISRLKFVVEQTEGSFEGLLSGLKILSKNAFDAASGSKEASKAFDVLGISVTDATGQLKQSDRLLIEISDKFKNLGNETEKAALAQKLFGRSGLELVPVLSLGSDEIERLSKQADRLGLTLTADNAKAIDEFSDGMKELKSLTGGLALAVGTALIPSLNSLVKNLSEFLIPKVEKLRDLLGDLSKASASFNNSKGAAALGGGNKELNDLNEKLLKTTTQRQEFQGFQRAGATGSRVSDKILELQQEEKSLREQIVAIREKESVKIQEQQREQESLNRKTLEDPSLSSNTDIEAKIQAVLDEQEKVRALTDQQLQEELNSIQTRKLATESAEQQKTQILQTELQKRIQAERAAGRTQEEIEKRRGEILQTSLTDGINAIQVLGRESKAAAIAFKVIETGKTVIAGARAFAEALPNFGLAALVAAATAAKVAVINAVQFAEGSANVPKTGGVTHPGEIVVPKTFADSIRSGDLTLGGKGQSSQTLGNIIFDRIEINVNGNLDREVGDDLIRKLGEDIESRLRGVT